MGHFTCYIPGHCSGQCLWVFDKSPVAKNLGAKRLSCRNFYNIGIFKEIILGGYLHGKWKYGNKFIETFLIAGAENILFQISAVKKKICS